ncbi:MAG: hypothetical protein H7Y11_01780, partial [Armatimonadetes bacterium]|nr:hypothetical protein [Anaerolineae bacterium]
MPESLYARIRQIALEHDRLIEDVLLDSLALLFGELPPAEAFTLAQLAAFSNEQLWALVHRPLVWFEDLRLSELTARSKISTLTHDEQAEIEHLITRMDYHIVLRSQALLLLKQRGVDVEQQLKLGA